MLLDYADKAKLDVMSIKKEVVSGESLARRPEMLKLLEEVEEGLYDAVLVKDFDRLGRGNMMEQGIIIETFRKTGTKIITPDKLYDLENEFDEEYIDISAFFARKELKMITKRLQCGRMKSVSDGNYISPYAPFGYDKRDKTLAINEKESQTVKLIFELYANQGYGDTRIAKYLTGCGVPNKHGRPAWDKTTVRNIIRNPVYIGKVSWNKRAYRYRENGKRTSRFSAPSGWKVYNGRHDAIIDEKLFEKAQNAISRNTVPRLQKAKVLRNPMANMMRCRACGAAMTIRTSAGKADTLRCCRNCGITMGSYLDSVEERLVVLLLRHFSECEIPFHYAGDRSRKAREYPVLSDSLETCITRKIKLTAQMDKLHDLLEQGVYDSEIYIERSRKLTEEQILLENSIKDIKNRLSEMNDCEAERPHIKDFQQFLRCAYVRLDAENRNEFLRGVLSAVIYSKPKGSSRDGFSLEIMLRE
jgi:DNA invertase Pin-like site-specific DNA recombinase